MPVFNKAVSWDDSSALFPLEDWTQPTGSANIQHVNAYQRCQLIRVATPGQPCFRLLPLWLHITEAKPCAEELSMNTAAAGFKADVSFWEKHKSTAPAPCQASPADGAPACPQEEGKKVPLPAHTSMYLLQHRTQETPAGACTFLLELKNCWGHPVQQHHLFPVL